jgi:antitoxin component YwqK of YwqJK toxin-antitoxin module
MKHAKVLLFQIMLLTALSFVSCGNKNNDERYDPHTFNLSELDSLVKQKQAMYSELKSPEGQLKEARYYLGDSVKFIIQFDKEGILLSVSKFEGASEVWLENYYPNSQRMSRIAMKTDPKTGETQFEGPYSSYYETGWIKEKGFYKNNKPYWMLPYSEKGISGDTIFYEYQ